MKADGLAGQLSQPVSHEAIEKERRKEEEEKENLVVGVCVLRYDRVNADTILFSLSRLLFSSLCS